MDNAEIVRMGHALRVMTQTEGWRVFQQLVEAKGAEVAHMLASGAIGGGQCQPEEAKPEWWQGRYRGICEVLQLVGQVVENAQMVAEQAATARKPYPVRMNRGDGPLGIG